MSFSGDLGPVEIFLGVKNNLLPKERKKEKMTLGLSWED